jgi:hypothetical protein
LARKFNEIKIEKNQNLITMKTIKIKLTVLSFAIALTVFSFTTYATENNTPSSLDLAYFEDYFWDQDYTEQLKIKLISEVQIQVYNEEGSLIATGDQKDDKIKTLLNISDLLTEVNGTKFYRLSYQPSY